MTTQQPDALRLANILRGIDARSLFANEKLSAASAALENQHARITELESQLAQRFDAADMATASAQGFRDGVASVSAWSEPVAEIGSAAGDCAAFGERALYPLVDIDRFDYGTMLYAHPSPPDGMAGWISVDERLPEPDGPVLAYNGKWTGVAAWMSGEYLEPLERWQDEHREFIEMMGPAITHWMKLPESPYGKN